MDSASALIVVGVVACAAMAAVAWSSTKNNRTIDHLARSAERTAERNDRARDRLCQIMIEKFQVHGDANAVVQLANLHANESTRANDRSFQHDHAVESLDVVAERRLHRREKRAVETLQAAASISNEDGM